MTEEQFVEFLRDCVQGTIYDYEATARPQYLDIIRTEDAEFIRKGLRTIVDECKPNDIMHDLVCTLDESTRQT
jgi:hypothetical protein